MGLDTGKTKIVGRATSDVQIKTYKTKDGKDFSKAVFTIAVNENWTDKSTTPATKKEHTEYFRCFAKGGMINAAAYIKKGQYVRVEAKKRERSYDEHLVVDNQQLYLPPLPGTTENRPLMIKRYITEFMVVEVGLQPKSWTQQPGQTAVAGPGATNVVYATTAGAPAPSMPAAPAPIDAAASAFVADNGLPANI
jgi:hypothetical protein